MLWTCRLDINPWIASSRSWSRDGHRLMQVGMSWAGAVLCSVCCGLLRFKNFPSSLALIVLLATFCILVPFEEQRCSWHWWLSLWAICAILRSICCLCSLYALVDDLVRVNERRAWWCDTSERMCRLDWAHNTSKESLICDLIKLKDTSLNFCTNQTHWVLRYHSIIWDKVRPSSHCSHHRVGVHCSWGWLMKRERKKSKRGGMHHDLARLLT